MRRSLRAEGAGRRLAAVPWQYVVIDEAQRLKNKEGATRDAVTALRHEQLALLTGTPVQNSVGELYSLLNLLDPRRFADADAFGDKFGHDGEPRACSIAAQLEALKSTLEPLMLRRTKEEIQKAGDLEIPLKAEVVLWVELTPAQRTEYRRLLEKSYHALTATKSASGAASKGNLGWQLRLLCDHPNLNLRDPRPASLPAPGGPAAEAALASLVDASGKLRLLHKLLGKLRANKQRVLIFSQFKNMLDLIEDSLHLGGYPHERLDGSVRRDLRDAAIDRFQRGSDADAFAFLLTTRAGGVGITLTAADTVVLYDSDWNPQNDLQGMARVHRIGQTKEVTVYRLIANASYERGMYERSVKKLGLGEDLLGIGGGGGKKGEKDESAKVSSTEQESLLRYGAVEVMRTDDDAAAAAQTYFDAPIDDLLLRSQIVGADPADADADGAADDGAAAEVKGPAFWAALLPEAAKQKEEGLERSSRRRTQTAYGSDDDSDDDDEPGGRRSRGLQWKGRSTEDADFDAQLSDAEGRLEGKAKGKGRRVVDAAVGRRVLCTSRDGGRATGVYRDDGKIEVDDETRARCARRGRRTTTTTPRRRWTRTVRWL